MKKWLAIFALILLAAIIIPTFWIRSHPRIPEPVYQGKPLSKWLEEADFKKPANSAALMPPATTAVQAIGTNALPWLLQEASLNNSVLAELAHALATSRFLRMHLAPLPDYQQSARRGFVALGEAGARTVAAGLQSPDERIRFGCVGQWELAKDYPEIIIEPMIRCLNDPSPSVRGRAANAIGMLHPQPDRVVPMLIQMLNDRDNNVRSMAALGLSLYNGKAKAAVPALLKSLNNADSEFEFFITNALKAIDPTALAKVPAK